MDPRSQRYNRGVMRAAAFGLACAVFGASQPAPAGDHDREDKSRTRKLVGAWQVLVTVRSCETGVALGPAFPTMLSFHEGGTLSSADTAFNPSLRSPGMGVWRRRSGDTYNATTYAFLFAAGAWSGTHRIVQTIEVGEDGAQFEGTASVEIMDRNGTVIATGCSTSVGQRIRG